MLDERWTQGAVIANAVGMAVAALTPVVPRDLIVTSGTIAADGDRLLLRVPTIRATLGRVPRAAVEASFVYRGPTTATAPLASGEIRRQVGLTLRAQDGCNVVYVMWHVAPTAGIHVSVKSNPGQTDSAVCGDHGYITLTPSWARTDLAPIGVGQARVLRATIVGTELRVDADGAPAWRAVLPTAAFAFDGPVGVRADNAELDVTLRASAPTR
jgi:hypothetical protein